MSPAFTESAVDDVDRLDLAGLDRLDHLHAPRRLEFSLRDRDDVDATDIGPGDRDDDEGADDPDEGDLDRRRRRLEDFERGSEKFVILAGGCGRAADWPGGGEAAPFRGVDRRTNGFGHAPTSAGWLCRPQR